MQAFYEVSNDNDDDQCHISYNMKINAFLLNGELCVCISSIVIIEI